GNSIAPLVLRVPVTGPGTPSSPWQTRYNSGFSIDQVGVTLTGLVNSSTTANRVLDACLSENGGATCASVVYQATATQSSAPITFGQADNTKYGACGGVGNQGLQPTCWLLDSKPRINSQEMVAHQ